MVRLLGSDRLGGMFQIRVSIVKVEGLWSEPGGDLLAAADNDTESTANNRIDEQQDKTNLDLVDKIVKFVKRGNCLSSDNAKLSILSY